MANLQELWSIQEPPFLEFDDLVPSFYFKGENSFKDHACFIDEHLAEMQAAKIIDSIKVSGKSGRLHRTLGDYDSFDYSIEIQLVDFERIETVKRWLKGSGKLILSTDRSKYRDAMVVSTGKPVPFINQMNSYWKFTVTFEVEPFKRSLQPEIIQINEGDMNIFNLGIKITRPYFKLQSKNSDIEITVNQRKFILKETQKGLVTLDCEKKVARQGNKFVKNIGEFPYAESFDAYENRSGENIWQFSGIDTSFMDRRSIWL